MYAFSQILGEIKDKNINDENYPIGSTIYSPTETTFCSDTWAVCDYDVFTTKYNLQSYQ